MKDMLKAVVAAAVVVSMVSCSSEADFDNTNTTDSNKQESVATPVNFGSYLAQSKSNLSRAGGTTPASEMTTAELQSKGFGVVAFYTKTNQYTSGSTKMEPNFMYNTRVSGTGWTYSPVMYWPNGGQTEGATPGEGTQYLSFFAYAPYKETFVDKGITALSSNSTPGDPTVSYTLGATGADADLLWGTAGSNGTTTNGNAQNGTDFNGAAKAKVNANLSKMNVGGKVKFNFKHALAKFGGTGAGTDNKTSGLMIVADIDNGSATTGGTLDGSTKITVKSIKIESVKAVDDGKMTTEASIPTSGTLNLATGVWTTNNNGKIDYEINSPSAAATEGATTQTMNESIAEPKTFESWDKLPAGVSTTAQSVYTESTPLLLIPDGNDHTLRISIDYIVRTKNASLSKGYTEVEQSFYKDLTLSKVGMNAKYNLLIHLGLTSVKFDATVSDWTNTTAGGSTSSTTSDTDPMVIYMPQNVAN
ncbi:fimbrillin family protein [Hallella absiana]|uniref:fimbrillin family protein n=1 Tax=Hallella absiana TaxID=2925336 RepID=UPI0021C5EFE2|nr:fimbrillin family protein [Hallella absiana]